MAGKFSKCKEVLESVRGQAKARGLYAAPATDGKYYAYLSKVDEVNEHWDALFELVNRDLLDAVLFTRKTYVRGAPWAELPIVLFDVAGADEETLLKTLGIGTPDDLAEGSWFELELAKGAKAGTVEGDLYDAGIDLPPQAA
ncbi:MAG: hypothetical protein ACTHNP_12285 [Solirubrobacterales bacterium]